MNVRLYSESAENNRIGARIVSNIFSDFKIGVEGFEFESIRAVKEKRNGLK